MVCPVEQSLEDPINEILGGIESFLKACDHRIHATDVWSSNHLEELNEFRKRTLDLQMDLLVLRNESE